MFQIIRVLLDVLDLLLCVGLSSHKNAYTIYFNYDLTFNFKSHLIVVSIYDVCKYFPASCLFQNPNIYEYPPLVPFKTNQNTV